MGRLIHFPIAISTTPVLPPLANSHSLSPSFSPLLPTSRQNHFYRAPPPLFLSLISTCVCAAPLSPLFSSSALCISPGVNGPTFLVHQPRRHVAAAAWVRRRRCCSSCWASQCAALRVLDRSFRGFHHHSNLELFVCLCGCVCVIEQKKGGGVSLLLMLRKELQIRVGGDCEPWS